MLNFNIIKIKNNTFKDIPIAERNFVCYSNVSTNTIIDNDVEQLIPVLRSTKDIIEKQFGNISSFNFSRKVFTSGKWNELSKLARGLFINTETKQIVGRGYNKFFNFNEGPFNSTSWLFNNLKFPVEKIK